MPHKLKALVDAFPAEPGVYLMKGEHQKIIYVGKAKNLKKRVKQYLNDSDSRPQISYLMSQVIHIDTLVTASEKEALLLENSLIKKHKPRYNIFLKDDKNYLALKINHKDAYPKLTETRRYKKDGALYYGPFINPAALREVKDFIYRFFKLRTCSDAEFNNRSRPCLEYQIKRCSAPCVQYVTKEEYRHQIDQVRLFLEGKSQVLQKEVLEKINQEAKAQNFEEAARWRDLWLQMKTLLTPQNVIQLSLETLDILVCQSLPQKLAFAVVSVREGAVYDSKYFVLEAIDEPALAFSQFITQFYRPDSFIPQKILTEEPLEPHNVLLEYLSEAAPWPVRLILPRTQKLKSLIILAHKNLSQFIIQNENDLSQKQNVLETLQSELSLQQKPLRIEGFDISHHRGKSPVGSMVVFLDGKKSKADYKKFSIQSQNTQSDYAMLYEVLSRRFAHAEWPMPDLILVDGGKGQLSEAKKIIQELGLDSIPLAAIAKGQGQGARAKGIYKGKKQDEIYIVGRKNPILLNPKNPVLMLLQEIRDESHRFAIGFHRQKALKALTAKTPL